jgi:hypothetical protein
MKVVLAALLLGSVSASAQTLPDAASLLNHFITRCNEIAADPARASQRQPGAGSHIAQDQSLITYYEAAFANSELFFRQMRLPGGLRSDCTIGLRDISNAQYQGLGALIAENGATLFGTEVLTSGDYDQTNAILMIATPDFPPRASLTLIQQLTYIELILSQNTPQ